MITSNPAFGHDVDDVETPHADPIALMQLWLPPNGSELRPLAALATVGLDGIPAIRHVLISERDDEGLYFHTDATSRKAAELAANPVAAMTVAWPEIGRQLVVRGTVEPLTPAESAVAYRVRSRYLQLLAWQNTRSTALASATERRALWAEFDLAHPVLEPPAEWTGYRIRPRTITFWRGDPAGPSNRHEYSLGEGGWTSAILPG